MVNANFSVIYSVTPDSGPSQLSIVIDTTTTTTASRRWDMRIYQYECTSPVLGIKVLFFFILQKIPKNLYFFKAPNGCLQYYMAASGQIHSLNYKTEVQDVDSTGTVKKPNHLANLNYAICIRMESGFCGIRYSQVDNFSFGISGDAAPVRISHNFLIRNSLSIRF